MRRSLFILALLLLLGGLAAWQLQQGHGYILIAVGTYTLEMSLWVGILLVALLWILWSVARGLLARLFGPSRGLLPVWRHARQRRQRERRDEGLLELLEGRWNRAQKLLERSGRKSAEPLLNWLAAAAAALEEGDYDEARRLLGNAAASDPDGFGVKLLEARLLLRQQRHGEALPILESLHSREPTHHEVLRSLVVTHRALENWQSLEKLLPELKRRDALSTTGFNELSQAVYGALLEQAVAQDGSSLVPPRDRLLAVWERIPAAHRRDSAMVARLIRLLHRVGEGRLAESQLRNALKREWNDELVELYGIIEHRDLPESLAVAEKWLSSHRDDPVLLLTLGRLCHRAQLWGKARDYLEAALRIESNVAVYAELAALSAHLGDTAQSAQYYRMGLEARTGGSLVEVSAPPAV